MKTKWMRKQIRKYRETIKKRSKFDNIAALFMIIVPIAYTLIDFLIERFL